MTFDIGEHVGEMHCHTPSRQASPLCEGRFQTRAIHEISLDVANGIAKNIGLGSTQLLRSNKEAYVVSEDDGLVLVVYSYDHRFYLTSLSNLSI